MNEETTLIRPRETVPPVQPSPGAHLPPERPRRAQQRGSLGIPEIIALAASTLLLLAAVGSYFFLLRPQRVRAEALAAERVQLEKVLQTTRGSVTEGQDTQSSVRDILGSLQRFEIEHLGQGAGGSTNTITELHRMMLKNNLRISGGMTYTQLEETLPGAEKTQRQQPRAANAGRVVQSVFPGIGITMTVEGAYPNLRRFIREVEASRQFIVINGVELEGVTDTGAAGSAPNSSGARGTLVSLRLDMAAYFRRAAAPADLTPLGGAADATNR